MKKITNSRKRQESGIALVAATIATLALAGAVAVFQAISGQTGELAGANSGRESLDSFAMSLLNLCPGIVDSARQQGDYTVENFVSPNRLVQSGSFTIQVAGDVLNPSANDIDDMNKWADYSGGNFMPDIVATAGDYSGFLDVDYVASPASKDDPGLLRNVRWGQGGVASSGYSGVSSSGMESGGDVYPSYRCFAWAYDSAGNDAMYVGILER